ncbi:MAG: sel1 repeat family protein [Collinsella sp.]|nr:sel1 repeat family protein [Collinsella sp.]MCI6406215.1 sel1 repeat family protein [Collinsella sp.]MCI6567032.1 sel1 repeat family protein [Collinsella sp.]MDD6997004.1 tetratricopeptide repeat protein [Collinsella sp.]MDY3341047.1 tetratricopeptide repeat protein [Collinsella sp.]
MDLNPNNAYGVEKEDVARMAELAGMEFVDHGGDEYNEGFPSEDLIYGPEQEKDLLAEMANVAFSTPGDDYAQYICENRERVYRAARMSSAVREMLVLGYRLGVSSGSGACMNDLGALYYMGDLVEQDYAKAAELYEMAADAGCFQSIINLGYIYEYGRTGKPDHAKAYQWYSLAAALAPSSEAVYKLGDMFSRGRAVPQDRSKAYRLYERSLELARDDAEFAQPAIRIASMLIDPDAPSCGIDRNPLRALALYQRAEIGLRIDIANGMTYYAKRLREAIEGQEKARELVEMDNFVIDR